MRLHLLVLVIAVAVSMAGCQYDRAFIETTTSALIQAKAESQFLAESLRVAEAEGNEEAGELAARLEDKNEEVGKLTDALLEAQQGEPDPSVFGQLGSAFGGGSAGVIATVLAALFLKRRRDKINKAPTG